MRSLSHDRGDDIRGSCLRMEIVNFDSILGQPPGACSFVG